ncbi:MAG: Co2+/Mg2+ efflux protein ApaG [Xanthomonadales bacterium]|nr:Co2+/Mg2+ efflux protein ApaG [Xanthomonadales bacterium]
MSDPRYAIRVEVESRYLPEQSEPRENRFAFAYTVRITNEGRLAARLLGRHWIIVDGNGKVQEVRGEGVVGEQPRLRPGERYEYTSGAVLETAVGTMRGSYEMLAEDGTRFLAPIPTFRLAVPRVIH